MNRLLLSFFVFFVGIVNLAGQDVKLVMVTTAAGMPEGADFQVKPMGYEYGVTCHFIVAGENFVSLEKTSIVAEGWEAGQFPKVSEDGTLASFSVRKAGDFIGAAELPAVEGTVEILTASESATEKLTLKAGGEPVPVGELAVELVKGKGSVGLLGSGGGVRIEGNHAAIKSVVIIRDGEEIESRSSTWNDKAKTFGFEGLGDEEEVVVSYWKDLEPRKFQFRN